MSLLLNHTHEWNKLSLEEQLERIRKHLCSGPCAQSGTVLATRERINTTLKDAIKSLNTYKDFCSGLPFDPQDLNKE